MHSTLHPWLDRRQFPFATREFDSGEGWMSYVDSGHGRPIVFVHGSMTWSYLFRGLIHGLDGQYRCIAPDHLGCGLSDKPAKVDYGPVGASRRFAALMDHLRLRDITLVLHDFGGPIGLDWAIRNSHRVREIVLFNSWAWSLAENEGAQRIARLIGNPINRLYYRVLNASPSFILPTLFADRHRLPRATQMQYMEPFRRQVDREGVYGLVESWRTGEEWFERLWSRREALAHKPFLFLWGMKDPLFGRQALNRFESAFPEHRTIEFSTGRFIPEEKPRELLDEFRWHLLNSSPARVH